MKNIYLTAFVLFSTAILAQKHTALYSIKIPNGATIIKTVKVKDCDLNVDSAAIVRTDLIKKSGTKTITVTTIDTLRSDSSIQFDKEVQIKMTDLSGKGTLFTDPDDKSKVFIDFWLNNEVKLKCGTKIKIIKRTLQCPKGSKPKKTDYLLTETIKTLKADSVVYLTEIPQKDGKATDAENASWYVHSDMIIQVLGESGEVERILVNKYDRKGEYELKLANREFISYRESGLDFGPLTVPFKFRPGFKRDSIQINSEVNGDLNLGVFGAYRFGKYRARYEKNGFRRLPSFSLSIGGFISLSSATLNKSVTTVGENPIITDEDFTIGVVSPGLGVMVDFYNVNLGVFWGWDLGVGSQARNWNFNNRSWIGIGLAYNLNGFWSAE